jgi:hypothetical protein
MKIEKSDQPTEKFYNVKMVEGNFFVIDTVKIQGDKVVSREENESDYMAVQLMKLKHKTFGRYYFPDKAND